MKIENCSILDLPEIFRLYRIASDYQRSKQTVVVWPEFETQLIEKEIAENRQWKLMIDGKIACVWASTFSDEQIWEERNAEPSVYIHRIATNPEFRGNNFVSLIVEWVRKYAKENNKKFVRLDTLGNNKKLIEYYQAAGFNFLGMFDLKDTSSLPAHYHNVPACLFEISIES